MYCVMRMLFFTIAAIFNTGRRTANHDALINDDPPDDPILHAANLIAAAIILAGLIILLANTYGRN